MTRLKTLSRTGLVFTALYFTAFFAQPSTGNCGFLGCDFGKYLLALPWTALIPTDWLTEKQGSHLGAMVNAVLMYQLGRFFAWFARRARETRADIRDAQRGPPLAPQQAATVKVQPKDPA
ncbi:hypothetical protein BRI6_1763 [plant metagenome]|uniref:Uncharacterized protein n=1 Tax=plant metagenome TaxID=1297885 RepID=A0A484XEX5_9ZZZZ